MARAHRSIEIASALRRLAAVRPDTDVDVGLALAILELQERLEARTAPRAVSAEEAAASIAAGNPLIDGGTALASAEVRAAAERLCDLLVRRREDTAPAVAAVMLELERPSGSPPELYSTVVALALRGLLRPWATALAPLVDDRGWLRPQCPVCGGVPDLAVMADPVRERSLLCSRCDAEWLYARIGCPFCGNGEPDRLGYYPADGSPYRVYVCDACGAYLKAVEIKRGGPRCPPAERILATPLDRSAAQLGYVRPEGRLPALVHAPATVAP